ncbi:STE/STE20/SLK protein kinase [Salpingoeca rosetta]|uniref:STE/STE20/SLK protein kinase n=1 Tax=Salpingoeca rosetta (strain ATCC 50818 / BSB-021) TaxID=946362 RepID=F2UMY9_SALR5|nr:STE/STE20/SLK protein kinase [Salpingoeca rosetta]EGD78488.1 STE/STE20/SLK protein kinase [Salpingoeca rosetta]|eukprot:XP_004989437.1 STE/STE20/SLK protein kinase [Salpingoeca rosetta]
MPSLFGKLFGGKQRRLEKALANIDQTTDPSLFWKTVGDLGEGTFGTVHKVKHAETGEFAAAKIIPIESEEDLFDYAVEADILLECPHEHIVGLRGAYLWKSKLWIVMELCEGGALDDALIELERGLEEAQIRVITRQLLLAIAHLHGSTVIHRDLKAGNLLLDRDGNIKLTDFGVSSYRKKQSDSFIGTPYWMAPEVIICENIRDRPYNAKADIWSLGITLIELAETSPPYHDMHPMRVLFKIPKSAPPTLNEPHLWSAEFSDFLQSCLHKDPSDRPTAEELLAHPFVHDATDNRPLRNLFKLLKADVVETIEDLSASATAKLAESNIRHMQQIAQAARNREEGAATPQPTRPAPPPPAGPLAAAGGSDTTSDTTATTVAKGARSGDDIGDGDGDGDGEDEREYGFAEQKATQETAPAITVDETAAPSSSSSTAPQSSSAMGDSSATDASLLSAGEDGKKFKTLTKTRTFVNEDGQEVTFTTSRIVATSRPHGYTMKGKPGISSKYADWEQTDAQKTALLRNQQLREMRQLRREETKETNELVARLKAERETNRAVQRTKTLPRKERRASKREAVETASQTAEEHARTLDDQQHQEEERELKMLRAQQRAEMLRTRLTLMQREHDILHERADKISDLGHQHMLETHQMLRHQLHATFLLQKHQEFKSNEERKYNMMKSKLEEAYQDARQSLLRQMDVELEELREQQQLKKQAIITNETKKLRELDEKHAAELREYKSQVAASRAQLDDECTAERRRIEAASGSRTLIETEQQQQQQQPES